MNTLIAAIFALYAAFGGPNTNNKEKKPPADVQIGQHFCCDYVDIDNLTGNHCVAVHIENINSCVSVLYCNGDWAKHDDQVVCK